MHDVAIIGGGIIGVACALQIAKRYPGFSVVILEKEDGLAQHQSGRNSGVIHAGVYYKPGTLKAILCKEGVEATLQFCKEHDVPFDQCGKMIVATEPEDMSRLIDLHERSKDNGLNLERLDATELSRREPRIRGLGALFSPTTGIVDYGLVTSKMGELFKAAGGEIETSFEVMSIREGANEVEVSSAHKTVKARNLIVCAGVMADRVAKMSGLELDFQHIPFRGEYYRLQPQLDNVVGHLIYPVPDPALPFLGVHLTRMIGGYVTVGPNAVLAMGRESYKWSDVDLTDLMEIFGYRGFRKMARENIRTGLAEMWNSLSKRRYLELCRRYCPELTVEDFLPYRPGIRAQAVMSDGRIEHDFIIRSTNRVVHVCNAPSPAATSSIPISRNVIDKAAAQFGWA
jgi:L-2-hydroxyglutarate oxidase